MTTTIHIDSLKELAKQISYYQSSISEEERVSLILFALKSLLLTHGVTIAHSEGEIPKLKVSKEYFDSIKLKPEAPDLSWLKHGEQDLQGQSGSFDTKFLAVLNKVQIAYLNYFHEILRCGGVTHTDFVGLDKYMCLLKALFFYMTDVQPYNFTKAKPTLATIQKMLKDSIPDLQPDEVQGLNTIVLELIDYENEAV